MTQIRRKLADYAGGKYLNATEVAGSEGPAVITHASEDEIRDEKAPGGKKIVPTITLDRWPDKSLILNVTNIRALQDMLGEDIELDGLRGTRIHIVTESTPMGRGVRLYPPKDSVQQASSEARQRIAAAQSKLQSNDPAPAAGVTMKHNHGRQTECDPGTCPVGALIRQGTNVYDEWPDDDAAPGAYRGDDPGPGDSDDIPF